MIDLYWKLRHKPAGPELRGILSHSFCAELLISPQLNPAFLPNASNPFLCHTSRKSRANSNHCHTSKNPSCKSFACHTYEIPRGWGYSTGAVRTGRIPDKTDREDS